MSTETLQLIEKYVKENLGDIGIQVYQKSISKLNIKENPTQDEIENLIQLLEKKCTIFCGTEKSKAIFENFRKKMQLEKISKPEDTMDLEIEGFLRKRDLPNEEDIRDYAKYLTLKYGGNEKNIENDIIVKVKMHIKKAISQNKINKEIDTFLERFIQPAKSDVDDFIQFIRVLKLDFNEDELRERVERERLFRKFRGVREIAEKSEIDSLINFVKYNNKKEDINNAMKKHGVSYLIKDETGVSDKYLSEFAELMKPNEDDMKNTLQGLGLEHMIRKKTT
jgi:RNA polymerase-interacting CarD/CdnL/TRCF family regulator